MNNKEYFKLYANCIPVKGAKRSIICDIQNACYRIIPNLLFDILTLHSDKKVSEIKEAYQHRYDKGIDHCFEALIDEDYGFMCSDPSLFPELDLTWESPSTITNCIIDSNMGSAHNFPKIIAQLNELGCRAIQYRFFSRIGKSSLVDLLDLTVDTRIKSVDIIAPFGFDLDNASMESLFRTYPRLSQAILFGAPENREFEINDLTQLYYIQEQIDSSAHCGIISPEYFTMNPELFYESVNANACLNRKLGIDVNGDIKNCPSMSQVFGNVKTNLIANAISHPAFRKKGSITKDQIDVCKDCEFRYICTDCRAFVEGQEPFGKPSKCKYNPYEATWAV